MRLPTCASALLLTATIPATAADPGLTKAESSLEADPLFAEPYVDLEEWRDLPVRHRYVHGGFKGTDLRFSYYFPPKEQYEGRFFQYVTPVPDSEHLSQNGVGEEDKIGFAAASGAYFVETNGGGSGLTEGGGSKFDPTIGGYRANAAAARYSRIVAARLYGPKRPFGYIFGGSGGAYRTLGSIENTKGVWDGAVPYVLGSTMASPTNFTVRMHAMRVLQDKFPQIVDALEPGGSGDPYAGLNEAEAGALREATRMGFPPQSWFGWKTMGVHAFTALYGGVQSMDPAYFDDFWTKPGYLGFEGPESLTKARLQFRTQIKASLSLDQAEARGIPGVRIAGTARGSADLAWQAQVSGDTPRPVALQFSQTPPEVGFLGGDLLILSGEAKGMRLALRDLVADTATLGVVDVATLAKVKPGDEVQIDNSNFLAAQTYHRHQDPGSEYPVWSQFRKADGTPIYPQRSPLLGPLFTQGAAGAVPTGRFEGKMIIVESLWDREAWPWAAEWYRQLAEKCLADRTEDRMRIWMTDRALHGDSSKQEEPTQTVSYLGVLQQALRDLSAWVEKGQAPPASTVYRIDDGQVIIPATAKLRGGIQPVVNLAVNGRLRVETTVGQPVDFVGTIELPPGTGSLIAAEWDFDGSGDFAFASDVPRHSRSVKIHFTHVFQRPGTYFPVLRGVAQRNPDGTDFARIPNLGRVRVVVREN